MPKAEHIEGNTKNFNMKISKEDWNFIVDGFNESDYNSMARLFVASAKKEIRESKLIPKGK